MLLGLKWCNSLCSARESSILDTDFPSRREVPPLSPLDKGGGQKPGALYLVQSFVSSGKKPMRHACITLLLFATAISADPSEPIPPAEILEAIKNEHKAAEQAFVKAVRALKDTPEDQKKADELWKAFDKRQTAGFAAAVKLAKAEPKSELAFTALEWVLAIPRARHTRPGADAMELVAEHHATDPRAGPIAEAIAHNPPRDPKKPAESLAVAWELVRAVAEKNPNRAARGQAHLALALQAHRRFAAAEYQQSEQADKLAAEAETAFEILVNEYGDCQRHLPSGEKRGTIGDYARSELFELRRLRVGKVAPPAGR